MVCFRYTISVASFFMITFLTKLHRVSPLVGRKISKGYSASRQVFCNMFSATVPIAACLQFVAVSNSCGMNSVLDIAP